jgi:hypothetical protein
MKSMKVSKETLIMCRLDRTLLVYSCWFIFSRIKKGEGQGKEKCHAKSMMSKEAIERLKRDTQHVPLFNNIFFSPI